MIEATAQTVQAPLNYLQISQEAFTESTTFFDNSIRPQAEAGLRQFQGVHPKGSKYHSEAFRGRSRIFRPKTRATIRKNEAVAAEAFFSTQDVVSITPEDDNSDEQRASAAVHQSLLQYRLKKSVPWFLTLMGAYQDAMTVGVCISHQYWRYDKRRGIDMPVVDLIPVENLRLAPGCDWTRPIESTPYLIRMIPMYVKDVMARMSTVDPKTGQAKWKRIAPEQLLAAQNAGDDTTRQTRERGRTDSKQTSSTLRMFAIVWVHEVIMDIEGEDKVWYTLGTLGMLSDPVPLKERYFHGRRPFTMGYTTVETHKPYPEGETGITKDIQAEINEIANSRIDNVKFAMNKRYHVKRGTQVDLRSLTRNVPGSVTMMNNPETDVKVIETKDVTASAYEEQDRLNTDFDDVAGAFSPSSVASNRKLGETVGGLTLLSNDSNQVGSYRLHTFVETWVVPTLRQLMLLEAYYETDQVILAMATQQAAELFQKLGVDSVTDSLLLQELTTDVNVGIGATSPQDKINNFMLAMSKLREILIDGVLEKYGLDVAEVIKELFGHLGYRDGSRFFSTEEEDPRLTAAKKTIQELQQALQAKVDPMLVAAQVRKLDADINSLGVKDKDVLASAVEKSVRAIFSASQAAQVIASVPALAPVTDAVLVAAGRTEPTPGGVDPNLPQLGGPAAGLVQDSVKDPRTGIEFMPGGAVAGDTDPLTPMTPASPGTGAQGGIETARADSA